MIKKTLLTTTMLLGLCVPALAQTGADVTVPLKDAHTILDAKSYVDTYDPEAGAYGVDNVFAAPTFSTGHVMPDVTAPTGLATLQDTYAYDKQNVTLSQNLVCNTFSLVNWSNLTIKGKVTIVVNKSFTIENQSNIILEPGAKLTIYTLGTAAIQDHCKINPDTTRPGDVFFVQVAEQPLLIENQSWLVGMAYVPKGSLQVTNGSEFFGGLQAKSLYIANRAAGHFTKVAPTPTTVSPQYD